jgi:hypothetical protein
MDALLQETVLGGYIPQKYLIIILLTKLGIDNFGASVVWATYMSLRQFNYRSICLM